MPHTLPHVDAFRPSSARQRHSLESTTDSGSSTWPLSNGTSCEPLQPFGPSKADNTRHALATSCTAVVDTGRGLRDETAARAASL